MRRMLGAIVVLAVAATVRADERAIVAQAKPDPAVISFQKALNEALAALSQSGGYTVQVESQWGALDDQQGPKGGGRYQMSWQDGKYRVEMRSPVAKAAELVCVNDKANVTTYFPAGKLYSQHAVGSPQSGLEFNKMLGMSLQGSALDILLQNDVAGAVQSQVAGVKDAGQELLGGKKAHRFEVLWAGAKVELWFAVEGSPLLLQFVRTTSVPTGAGQHYAMFCKANFQWQLGVSPPPGSFVIDLPSGTQRVNDIYDALAGADASVRLGKSLPKIELARLDGADHVLGAAADKKATVLVFWATWCAASIEDFPAVQKFVAQYKDRGIQFYAVNAGEQPGVVRRFVAQHPLVSTVLLDPHSKATAALHIQQLPAVAVIAPDNTIAAVLHGSAKDLQNELASCLNEMIAGQASSTARRSESGPAK